jgi:hypothetical protein
LKQSAGVRPERFNIGDDSAVFRKPSVEVVVVNRDGWVLTARARASSKHDIAAIDRLPRPEWLGQHPPAATGAHQVARGVDHLPESTSCGRRRRPGLGICGAICSHSSSAKSDGQRLDFLEVWIIRPRLCSVQIQSLNHKSLLRASSRFWSNSASSSSMPFWINGRLIVRRPPRYWYQY